MSDLFKRFRQYKFEVLAKTFAEWRRLVIDRADDKPISEKELDEALEKLGRTIDDLEQAVLKVKKRRSLREKKGQLAKAEANVKKAEKILDAAEARLEPIQKEYDEASTSFTNASQFLSSLQQAVNQDHQELINTTGDAEALARVEELRKVANDIGERYQAAMAEAQRLNEQAHLNNVQLSNAEHSEEKARLQTKVDEYVDRHRKAIEEADAIQKELKAADLAVRDATESLANCEL